MDEIDHKLITLLENNARMPTSSLARNLQLSRSTVQSRLEKLERRKIIAGYTIRLNKDFARRKISAHVMVSVEPKQSDKVVSALKNSLNVRSLYAISGEYDLIAVLAAETTEEIDQTLDEIGRIGGIEKTTSSIVLSTKFER